MVRWIKQQWQTGCDLAWFTCGWAIAVGVVCAAFCFYASYLGIQEREKELERRQWFAHLYNAVGQNVFNLAEYVFDRTEDCIRLATGKESESLQKLNN